MGGIAGPLANADDAGVATLPVGMLFAEVGEQFLDEVLLAEEGDGLPALVQGATLGESDHPVGVLADFLGFGNGGGDAAVLNQAADQIGQHGPTMLGFEAQRGCCGTMSHGSKSPSRLLGLGRRAQELGGGVKGGVGAAFDFHPQREAEMGEFVFDFVERFLAEVPVLEHFDFGLRGELANGGDVGVVQAVGGADAEFNLVDAHGEQFLELDGFGADFLLGFLEFDDDVLVVIAEHVEMMAEDVAGLHHRVFGRDAAIGPDFDHELVVIGALADARVFNGVADAADRGEQRVNRNDADGLFLFLVLFSRAEAAADFDFQLHVELLFLVERADVLVGVDDFDGLIALDVAGGNRAFLVDGEEQGVGFPVVRLQQHFFEVQDNVGDVFDNAGHGAEFMRCAVDADGRDRGAFERAEQHAAQRVADGLAVTGFKRLGNELGICGRGGRVFARQTLRHFKTT